MSLAFALMLGAVAFSAKGAEAPLSHEFPTSCEVVRENATQYLKDHGMDVGRNEMNITEIELFIHGTKRRTITDADGNRISLSRFGVGRYLDTHSFHTFGIYTSFQLWGKLMLTPIPDWYPGKPYPHECRAEFTMAFHAYHWSPVLVAEGDGFMQRSNTLEQGYWNEISHRLSSSR